LRLAGIRLIAVSVETEASLDAYKEKCTAKELSYENDLEDSNIRVWRYCDAGCGAKLSSDHR
jgi:hypothetical protein